MSMKYEERNVLKSVQKSAKKSGFSFLLHKALIDGLDYLWIIVMCLSAVWTLILTAPIHCRGSYGQQIM